MQFIAFTSCTVDSDCMLPLNYCLKFWRSWVCFSLKTEGEVELFKSAPLTKSLMFINDCLLQDVKKGLI